MRACQHGHSELRASIGHHISNQASFDQRNYGFKKLSSLFSTIDLFEMKKTNGSKLWVRDKKRSKKGSSSLGRELLGEQERKGKASLGPTYP
ncbi:OST-HTH/LOTUS domain-containing protein [Vibrio vulnificus]|uniref:OST-HTH/LOTUS domain-containing protein n=1 Tax=Vibrio vulnificus TaxID=672 RepID=UPI0021DAEA51|nr:OST-HTH/LOTUS domain-containing protein [Vibrio vulnificus]MCU8409754.1 OST-HTH/LOTUS domain-containing protein [Vibrio vulnificus]